MDSSLLKKEEFYDITILKQEHDNDILNGDYHYQLEIKEFFKYLDLSGEESVEKAPFLFLEVQCDRGSLVRHITIDDEVIIEKYRDKTVYSNGIDFRAIYFDNDVLEKIKNFVGSDDLKGSYILLNTGRYTYLYVLYTVHYFLPLKKNLSCS